MDSNGLPIERIDDDQNTGILESIVNEVSTILTENEKILYIAHQGRTVFGQKRDAVVATNNRVIIFQRHRFRGFTFEDFLWEDVQDVEMEESVMSSRIYCTLTNEDVYHVEGMVKKQTRVLYSICQQKEQEWRERRRVRKMEEDRAKAGGTQITMPGASETPAQGDPVDRLAQAKSMFDQELISEAEYETLKANILSGI